MALTSVHYASTDTAAPVLTGQIGSLISLLDAVLVNGYGTQPAAGWTKAYVATAQLPNTAVYTMGVGGTGFSMFVNDNSPYGIAKEAAVVGWQTTTGLNTGTGQFQSQSDASARGIGSGAPWRKSETADTTPRPWHIFADQTTMYLLVSTGNIEGGYNFWMGYMFGDLGGVATSDNHACLLMGNRISNNTAGYYLNFGNFGTSTADTELTAQCLAGSADGLRTAIPAGKLFDCQIMGGNYSQTNQQNPGHSVGPGWNYANPLIFPSPNAADGSIYMSPVRIFSENSIRGHLKGVWAPLHHRPLNDGDTFTVATGNLIGKSFLALNVSTTDGNIVNSNGPGLMVFETSNTWS